MSVPRTRKQTALWMDTITRQKLLDLSHGEQKTMSKWMVDTIHRLHAEKFKTP